MKNISENRTVEIQGIMLVAKKLKAGQFGLYSPNGVLHGLAVRRSNDWYAEIALGDEYYNACDETLMYVLCSLSPRKERIKYVKGRGAHDSKIWAERLRTNLSKLELTTPNALKP